MLLWAHCLIYAVMVITLTYAGSTCQPNTVPFQLAIDDNGEPEMQCSVPICGSLERQREQQQSETLTDAELFDRMKRNITTGCGVHQKTICLGASEWTGDLLQIQNASSNMPIFFTKCCTYPGLHNADKIPSKTLYPGQQYRGGPVYENGQFIAFDLIKEVMQVHSTESQLSYHLEIRRLNCSALHSEVVNPAAVMEKPVPITDDNSHQPSKPRKSKVHKVARSIVPQTKPTVQLKKKPSTSNAPQNTTTESSARLLPDKMTIIHVPLEKDHNHEASTAKTTSTSPAAAAMKPMTTTAAVLNSIFSDSFPMLEETSTFYTDIANIPPLLSSAALDSVEDQAAVRNNNNVRLQDEPRRRAWQLMLEDDYNDEALMQRFIRAKQPEQNQKIRYILSKALLQKYRGASAAADPDTHIIEITEDGELATMAKSAIPPKQLVQLAPAPPPATADVMQRLQGEAVRAYGTGQYAAPPALNQYQNPSIAAAGPPGTGAASYQNQPPPPPRLQQTGNQWNAPVQHPAPYDQPLQLPIPQLQYHQRQASSECCQPPMQMQCCNSGTEDDMQCFSGDTIVQTVSGAKTMRELEVGDLVQSLEANMVTYSPIVMFLHRLTDEPAKFLRLHLADNATLTLTGKHLIYVSDCSVGDRLRLVHAEDVSIGACAYRVNDDNAASRFKPVKVEHVEKITGRGIYAPLTATGDVVVNGVLASCHSNVAVKSLQQTFFAFVRMISRKLSTLIPFLPTTATISNTDLPMGVSAIAKAFDLLIPSS